MMRSTSVSLFALLTLCVAACGKTPAAPTPTPTRIIRLGGNLNFGDVQIGDVRTDGVLVVNNDGNAPLGVTGMTFPSDAYTSSWTAGSIAPSASQIASITFAPVLLRSYSGTITVNADQTGGTNTIPVLGVGVPVTRRIRFLGGTLPAGSTVPVSPLFGVGQQAPLLAFTAAITIDRDLSNGLVRAWVSTPALRCMGGGLARVAFQAGRELVVTTASMSNPGPPGQAICPLPYDTSLVEIEVLDGATPVIQQAFPVVYHFVR